MWLGSYTNMMSYGWNGGGCNTISIAFPGATIQGSIPTATISSTCGPATWNTYYYGQNLQSIWPPSTGLGLIWATLRIDATAEFWGPESINEGFGNIMVYTIGDDNPGITPTADIPEPAGLSLAVAGCAGIGLARRRRLVQVAA